MPTLKICAFFFLSLLTLTSFAAEKEKLLSVIVASKYSNQQTEVYIENGEMYCTTEINPKFYIVSKIQEKNILEYILETKKEISKTSSKTNCQGLDSPVMLTIKKEHIKSCSGDESTKKLLAFLAKACGRY